MKRLSDYQYALLLAALERKMRSYTVGDRMYEDYSELIKVIQSSSMTAQDWE